MALRLYYHPFASFCQKVLIALYEKGIAFEGVTIDLGDPGQRARLEAAWPMAKFPVLEDRDRGLTLPESSVIVEYLDRIAPAAPLIPADPDLAIEARLLDRVFDGFVAMQLTRIVLDRLRPEGGSNPLDVEEARATIARAYAMLDGRLEGRRWAIGDAFSLADCAAAPALFYANTAVPIGEHRTLAGYYERLRARPSFARVVEEARPYRALFPLEWPQSYRTETEGETG